MSETTTIRESRRWLFVPVICDEDGSVICWDVHHNEFDWAAAEPVASERTLAEAKAAASEIVKAERLLASFGVRA